MTPRHHTKRGRIYEARAEDVYPLLAPGSVQLVMSDGPYFLGKGKWDKGTPEDAPEWYRPHIEAWGVLCAPSASVYVWGTDASASALRPEMKASGWVLQVRITWDKYNATAQKADPTIARKWPDVTEVCDLYQREGAEGPQCAGVQIQYAAGADERNWIRPWLCAEWKAAGLRRPEADVAIGTKRVASAHYFVPSQWCLPPVENYQLMAAYAAEHGAPRERPYLVHPSVWLGGGEGVMASHAHLRAALEELLKEHGHLRGDRAKLWAEYEAQRVPFNLPPGATNVWRAPIVAGKKRLRGEGGLALHSCQKPLEFIDRMVRASSRPGALVLEPFGGTCRVAVACEALPPAEAREYVCVEVNDDGVDYLAPVFDEIRRGSRQLVVQRVEGGTDPEPIGQQVTLFG